MKKFIKIITVLMSVCALLLIAALIALKIMFPAEKLKSMAQEYVKNTFHREIIFSKVSFNFVGVTLENLAISENSTFEQGTFLKADQAVLKMALRPLLQKRIEIRTVGFNGLEINLIKQQDGTFNFDDLLSSDASAQDTEQTTTATDSSPLIITAEHLYASDCSLYYKDLQQDMSTSFTNLNLDIRDFDLTHPFTTALNFTTDYRDKSGMDITVPLEATALVNLANLNMEQASVSLQNLGLTYKTLRLFLQGKMENFEKPAVNLQGKLSGLSNTVIADIVPDLPHFVLPDINFTAQAQADLDKASATITQAKLSVADSSISTKGETTWGGQAATYKAQTILNLNLSQISSMTTLLDGYVMGGTLTGNLTATDKKDGKDINGTISLGKLTVQYDTLVLSDMDGTIEIKSLDQISANKLTGKLNEQPFTSSFAYKNLGTISDIVFNFDLSKLILTAFPSTTNKDSEPNTTETSTPADGPETFFNITSNVTIGEISIPYFESKGAALSANLQKASASMKQANGTVKFDLQEGLIKDLGNFTKGNKIVKIIMLPLSLINTVSGKLGLEIFPAATAREKGQIKFASGSGSYIFTDGVMNIQETHFNSSVSNITAQGNINFPTDALDMKVKATVLTSQTPIVIKIGGTLGNPSGKLDVTQTAVSLVGGILNYKTPVKTASTTASAAADVTKAVTNTGTDAVKTTINTATDAVKSIGGLFKKKKEESKSEE